jgi:hypothetical protein
MIISIISDGYVLLGVGITLNESQCNLDVGRREYKYPQLL